MDLRRLFSRRRQAILAVAGIALFCIFLLALGIDPATLAETVSKIDPRYVPLALAVDVGFILSFALAWFFLVKAICPEAKLKEVVATAIMSWFGDMLVPAAFVTGEAVRLLLLKELYGLEVSKAAAAAVVHRLLSALAFALFICTGILMSTASGRHVSREILDQGLLVVALASAAIVLGVLVLANVERVERVSAEIARRLERASGRMRRARLEERVGRFFASFKQALELMKSDKKAVFMCFAAMLVQWTLGASIPYVFFLSLGEPVSFWLLAIAFPIYGLVDNIPVGIPANAGVLDVAMASTFILLGISKEAATVATILTRTVTVLFEFAFTGLTTLVCAPRLLKGGVERILGRERGAPELGLEGP